MHSKRGEKVSLKSRLKSLLRRWAERETSVIRGVTLPGEDQFTWQKDQFGNYHRGSYLRGRFVVLRPGFEMIRGAGRSARDPDDVDEFGCAFRKLTETDQGLIVTGEFGGLEGWGEYITQIGLSRRLAEKRLKQAWLHLIIECRKRELL
jgi:hypothetical protein